MVDRLRMAQIAASFGFEMIEETDSHDLRFNVPATSGKTYRVARRRSTQAWECDCPSWKFAKKDANGQKPNCKHLNDLLPMLTLLLSSSASSVAIKPTAVMPQEQTKKKRSAKESQADNKMVALGRRQIG
jgi:hypothetical protein